MCVPPYPLLRSPPVTVTHSDRTSLSDPRGGGGGPLSEALEQTVGNSCVRSRQQLVACYCFLLALVPLFQTAALKAIKSSPQGSIGFEKSVRKAKMWPIPLPPSLQVSRPSLSHTALTTCLKGESFPLKAGPLSPLRISLEPENCEEISAN